MAASKKSLPFSRIRYGRNRKNLFCSSIGSSVIELRKSNFKSSDDNHKNRAFPLNFTVDDLAAYRRKKIIPGKLLDNLRPLSGKFSIYKSEYKKKYRSFIITPDDSKTMKNRKKISKKKTDPLKVEGDLEFNPEYFENFIEFPINRSSAIRPVDNLKKLEVTDSVFSTEHKENFVPYKQSQRAALTRRLTTLKAEGEFSDCTETKENYIQYDEYKKFKPIRQNTILKLEGSFDFLTENNDKYKLFEIPPRLKLIRRHSNLEISSDSIQFSTEYLRSFQIPQNPERVSLIKSMENLHTEGDLEFEPEYRSTYINFFQVSSDFIKDKNLTNAEQTNIKSMSDINIKESVNNNNLKTNLKVEDKDHQPLQASLSKSNSNKLIFNSSTPSSTVENGIKPKSKLTDISHQRSENGKILTTEESNTKHQISSKNFFDDKRSNIINQFDVEQKNYQIPDRSNELKFSKGKRVTIVDEKKTNNKESVSFEITESKRPQFRLEVTNPNKVDKPFNKNRFERTSFVILDENNNDEQNHWIKNKQNRN